MVKVSVMYPNHEGTKFDMTYYINRHIPMVRQLLGSALRGVSVEHDIPKYTNSEPTIQISMVKL